MPYQNIDAAISAADFQAIKDAFATIKQKTSVPRHSTVNERKATFKPTRTAFSSHNLCPAGSAYSF
ncbi:MAG: hypothetical protein DMF72_13445 [Acidobacteria bacterium]|nr:MAG: hypothetical protein DMF72_13445 [Acidobacteriota bacterium]